jgi:hypothetical protein
MVFNLLLVLLLATQWSFVFTKYNWFVENMLSEQTEVANLMTYVH